MEYTLSTVSTHAAPAYAPASAPPAGGLVRRMEKIAAAVVMAAFAFQLEQLIWPFAAPVDPAAARANTTPAAGTAQGEVPETIVGGYSGVPYHLRSDVHLKRPDGTDVILKNLRWDAEPFNFPLYAGVRAVHWQGPFGGMIDFLHDKAITRVGKGAHGRKVTGERAIPDTIETEGTWRGAPAPSPVKINELIDRLEFSHGHNMLIPTALARLGRLTPTLRPYIGFGFGAAIPHVEFWTPGEAMESRTNEYQLVGPAVQAVAGLEWQGKYGSIFVEYKFASAWYDAALTGGKTPAWCNCDIVSDTARHIMAWWNNEPANKYGELKTTLVSHQIVAGAGYRLGSRQAAAAAP